MSTPKYILALEASANKIYSDARKSVREAGLLDKDPNFVTVVAIVAEIRANDRGLTLSASRATYPKVK